MKVTDLFEAKKDTRAGIDEINKLVEPIFGSKLKPGVETPVTLDIAKQLNRAVKQAGYEVETHGATRKGKKVGTVSTMLAKSCNDVSFSVRTYKEQSHIFIIVT